MIFKKTVKVKTGIHLCFIHHYRLQTITRKGEQEVTRNEAIEHAEKLSGRGKPLAVIFDKEYKNYFITE